MNSLNKITWSLLFIFQTLVIQAQSFDDDVVDNNPPASINEWSIPASFIAIGFAFYLCQIVTRKTIKN
jgi:hypothetical protein